MLAVELDNIWKRFPGVVANAGAWLKVEPGSVHAVLGENGAGKTTLMNVLAGVYRPDEGTVRLDGVEQHFTKPADAILSSAIHRHRAGRDRRSDCRVSASFGFLAKASWVARM